MAVLTRSEVFFFFIYFAPLTHCKYNFISFTSHQWTQLASLEYVISQCPLCPGKVCTEFCMLRTANQCNVANMAECSALLCGVAQCSSISRFKVKQSAVEQKSAISSLCCPVAEAELFLHICLLKIITKFFVLLFYTIQGVQ